MKRMSPAETGILLVAVVFILYGASMIAHPTSLIVFHKSYRFFPSLHESIDQDAARGYGMAGVAMGCGLAALSLLGKKDGK